MSWWMIAILVLVVLRVNRRRRWERRLWQGGYGRFPNWADRSWREGVNAGGGQAPLPPAPPPPPPDPRRELERTIAAVRDAYVAGQITVEEYERRLDELYRTAEGKRLTQS